jgi:hypothetical protein
LPNGDNNGWKTILDNISKELIDISNCQTKQKVDTAVIKEKLATISSDVVFLQLKIDEFKKDAYNRYSKYEEEFGKLRISNARWAAVVALGTTIVFMLIRQAVSG